MHRAHSWKQSGNVSLWYYTENERNYPGWHLTADAAGCESLVALLDALAADGTPASRAVKITPPSKAQLGVPNNKSGLAAWRAPSKLRLAFSGNPADWSFPPDLDPALLTIGADWLTPLHEGISGIPHGRGDYSIGPTGKGSFRLWFWW
ncbi:hypothetical protein [Oleiagrimonas sp. MCCC 1A03011]|uniref:hypothetical protein n=1 Tax=Oleiagrimonas sp. MCCC 1A03011 TaxID=1926883 RepID=UPI000DC4F0DB|nr:hypothetical protein [Oleiagrimonas sp. MCCC 1A03011]RAP57337.1 hypothetical protein BTJ49_09645 [Oleiagrimonas sp. MCCC 1A03011]